MIRRPSMSICQPSQRFPDQTGRIHLQAVVDPAAFAEREVMPPDLRRDGLNDVHTGSFVRRSAR